MFHVTVRSGIVALTLIVAGCSGTPPTVQSPSTSQPSNGQPTSGQPSSTGLSSATEEPAPTGQGDDGPPDDGPEITAEALNPPRVPLPEPTLDDVDQIVGAMSSPGMEEQAIVSMLRTLGIGLYHADGTPIRRGTEQSDDDFYMYEEEAYGLAAMLRAQSNGEEWISFREFHEELVDFGLEATPEQLLDAYVGAYAQFPDAPMTQFVQAQAFLDVEAQMPPLGEWLLFVDGMIPPHASSQAAAFVGGGVPLAQRAPNIGVAFQQLQQLMNRPDAVARANAARVRAAMDGAAVTLQADTTAVHEGHGGTGTPVTFTARVNAYSPGSGFGFGTPLTGCQGGGVGGIPVRWQFDGALTGHGSTTVAAGTTTATDGAGVAKLTFTPQKEKLRNRDRARVVREVATVSASARSVDVARAMCPGVPQIGRRHTVDQAVRLLIRWHVPRSMSIILEQTYGIRFVNELGGDTRVAGQDSFVGRLAEMDDGSWQGIFVGLTQSEGNGVFWSFDPACPLAYSGLQLLEVFGEERPGRLPGQPFGTTNGDFVLEFFPAAPPETVVGTPDCPSARRPGSRYDYAPFNESAVWDTNVGLAIEFPTQEFNIKTYTLVSDNPRVIFVRGTDWVVDIHLEQDE